jgi:hypothetical protein
MMGLVATVMVPWLMPRALHALACLRRRIVLKRRGVN